MSEEDTICGNCGENVTSDLFECEECNNQICDTCSNICKNCGEYFCDSCFHDHKKSCK